MIKRKFLHFSRQEAQASMNFMPGFSVAVLLGSLWSKLFLGNTCLFLLTVSGT